MEPLTEVVVAHRRQVPHESLRTAFLDFRTVYGPRFVRRRCDFRIVVRVGDLLAYRDGWSVLERFVPSGFQACFQLLERLPRSFTFHADLRI
jgi:hypothetical protein